MKYDAKKISESEVNLIFKKKGVSPRCHRCDNDDLMLMKEFSYIPLKNGFLTVITILCNNCFAVSQHAILDEN